MRKVLCIYHSSCTDGFAAAWAVHRALGDTVEFHPGSYGNKPPDVTGRSVVIVDFSYKRDVLIDMARKAKHLLVLDHHKTAKEDIGDLSAPPSWGIFTAIHAPEWAPGVILGTFDMDRSGAGLAWDYFHPASTRPALIDLIEVRDLWRRNDERWENARILHAYLNSHPFSFGEWDRHAALLATAVGQDAVHREGSAILRQHDQNVAELVSMTTRRLFIGVEGAPVANLPPNMASDGGALMLAKHPDAPFVASYYDGADYRYFSLRSTDERMDVGAVAALHGGGGHRNASGFRVPRSHVLARA